METHNNHDFLQALTDPNLLYENAPCGYLSFTADDKIVKINQTLLSWLGYTRDEVVHKLSYKDLVSRGGKIYYEMFYMPLLRMQPHVNEINFDFVRADGSIFPALINSSIFHDPNGKIVAVNATVYNITDRKKYELELLEAKKQAEAERNKFELLSDFIPEMIFTADRNGDVNYVNRRFTSFLDLAPGSFTTKAIVQKIHAKDRFKLIRNWITAISECKDFQIEVRLQHRSGDFQWHLVRTVPIVSNEGEVEKWMGSCTDINRHVKAIQHLDEFIAVASHELKTPITSLNGSLQLMERMVAVEDNPRLAKLMAQSNKSIDKIKSLVDDLLHTGNIKEGQVRLHKKHFNVNQWLENTCTHVKLAGKYTINISCEPDLMMYGDEHRIDQIMVNFVNNAVKYAAVSPQITIQAEKIDGKIKVSVRDHGPGIPIDKLPYVFDRYYRVDYTSAKYSGLGLGLYICAEIIKRHGGEIGVESILGEGSTFWFTLPE